MKQLIVIGLIAAAIATCGNMEDTNQGELKSEVYIVKSGDTLDQIAYEFMKKSTVRRDVREFREGIIELNWDTVFYNRQPYGMIQPGDRLIINYYVGK